MTATVDHRRQLAAWAWAVLWLGVIATESSYGSATNTESVLRRMLELVFGRMSDPTFGSVHFLIRKAGHFAGYAVLSFLLYRAWWVTVMARVRREQLSWGAMFRAWSWRATLLALLGTVAVAGLDEWHQSSQSDRGGSVGDVLLDSMGGAVVQMAVLLRGLKSPLTVTPEADTEEEKITSA